MTFLLKILGTCAIALSISNAWAEKIVLADYTMGPLFYATDQSIKVFEYVSKTAKTFDSNLMMKQPGRVSEYFCRSDNKWEVETDSPSYMLVCYYLLNENYGADFIRNYLKAVYESSDIMKTQYANIFKPCAAGFSKYIDSETNMITCERCPIGTYRAATTVDPITDIYDQVLAEKYQKQSYCLPCPNIDPGNPDLGNGTTASTGTTSVQSCYIPPTIELTDNLGTFKYKANCHIPQNYTP